MPTRRTALVLALAACLLPVAATPTATSKPTAAKAKPSHAKLIGSVQFADPGFAKFGSYYYVYRTGSGFGVRASVSAAKDYGPVANSMPNRPSWVPQTGKAKLWAPHVFGVTDAKGQALYVMYFTGLKSGRGSNCIGIATSRSPDRDFVARKTTICAAQKDHEAIDPSSYLAKNGKRYLLYKTNYRNKRDFDIRAVQMNSRTGVRRVSGVASRSLVSSPSAKMEAPSAIAHGGKVWLFLSRGNYKDCTYSTDVWSAGTLWGGTFTRVKTLMTTKSTGLCGPGGATVLPDGKKTRIAFHAYPNHSSPHGDRQTYVGVLKWTAGKPYLY